MIIGAGKTQLALIEAAKKENYHTVVCDLDPSAPGVLLADEFCRVSTKDRFGLLATAKSNHIDGLVANSEYAMCDVAYIANKLDLIGNPESAVAALTSKSKFRALQKASGLFAPAFLPDEDIEQLLIDTQLFPFPVVIKPDQSSGTRGVMVIKDSRDHSAINQAINTARTVSRNGKAMAEKYIPMPARTVIEGEIFVHKSEILWNGLFHTIRSENAPTIPMTYVFPLQETDERIEAVKTALTKAFFAAGIRHGEYNTEMFFTEDEQPFLIEINARQGGYELPRLVREHCGIDCCRLLVTTAVGDDEYWESLKTFKPENRLLIHHMLFPRSVGRFREIEIAKSLYNKVFRSEIDVEDGSFVSGTVDAASCIGFVDLHFNSVEDQLAVSSRLEELIRVKVE